MGTGRRNTELGLLVLVVVITAGAYILASLGIDARIPVNIGPFLLILLGLLLLGNLVTRRFAPQADPLLLPLAALLNGLGYVMITRLDERLAGLQAMWTAVGMGVFALTLVVVKKARDLAIYRYTAMVLGLGLLLLPMVPGFGREVNGSRIWVGIGDASFQPGEFAKVVLAVFFAGYLVEKRELLATSTRKLGPIFLPDPRHFGPVLLAWGVSLVVMIMQKDLGSSLLFFALFIVMLWVATVRATYLGLGIGLFGIGAWFSYRSFGHVRARVTTWLDPWKDPLDSGYQVLQAAFMMAAGGIAGTGLGQSGEVSTFPAKETDFIFAFIAEELGLLGATIILLTFVLMVGSGLRIAVRSTYPFDKLLATGLSTLVGLQAFIIMAGVTRLLPLTGVTLPFVSYGGSSLVANYAIVALLLRISDESIRTPAVLRREAAMARSRQRVKQGRRRKGSATGVIDVSAGVDG
ncbi:MAG: FtsW/RodA/SpoVE family cell cycle protein [Acidimicrobiales bacterium]|nr:FtsW/RodA/SpoVE family cell cycle protein [Acidimicrobiales bacterium]